MSRTGNQRHAFTLVELLVIIAISAILISLLLPALQQDRSAAHTAMCLSDERQFGFALNSYLTDWNSYFPLGKEYCECQNEGRPNRYYIDVMSSYLRLTTS